MEVNDPQTAETLQLIDQEQKTQTELRFPDLLPF